jgi:hypothetical protein
MFRAGIDDPKREYEYAVEAVNHLAAKNNWQVINMKTIGSAFWIFQNESPISI